MHVRNCIKLVAIIYRCTTCYFNFANCIGICLLISATAHLVPNISMCTFSPIRCLKQFAFHRLIYCRYCLNFDHQSVQSQIYHANSQINRKHLDCLLQLMKLMIIQKSLTQPLGLRLIYSIFSFDYSFSSLVNKEYVLAETPIKLLIKTVDELITSTSIFVYCHTKIEPIVLISTDKVGIKIAFQFNLP